MLTLRGMDFLYVKQVGTVRGFNLFNMTNCPPQQLTLSRGGSRGFITHVILSVRYQCGDCRGLVLYFHLGIELKDGGGWEVGVGGGGGM